MANAGSWFGLPDFGLTERVSDALGKPRDVNSGSTLFGSPQAAAPTGQVAGASTTSPQDFFAYYNNLNRMVNSAGSGTGSGTSGGSTGSSGGGSAPAPSGFNPMDRNANPGEGWFWDAASGWKQSGGGSNPYEDQVRAREAQVRGEIEGGFGAYESRLNDLIPWYQGQQDQAIGSAQNTYNTMVQGLGQTKQTAMDKLNLNRGQVGTRMANSIGDLQNNLRNVTRNTAMQLGAMGAGDTSASNVMLPYAYTKLAGTEYGKIQRQGNDQLFQIDTQTKDTEDQYNQMVNQTEIEKESQLQGIRQQYGQMIGSIRDQMARVPADRAQALAALSTQMLQEANSRLSQVESYYMNQQQSLQDWAQNRMAQLDNYKLELNKSANFNPQDIVWNELQGGQVAASGAQGGDAYWNPSMAAKRKAQLGY